MSGSYFIRYRGARDIYDTDDILDRSEITQLVHSLENELDQWEDMLERGVIPRSTIELKISSITALKEKIEKSL